MIASAPLYEWLHWWEGREGSPALEAYQDGGGVWTIGYGRTENVKEFDRCTPDQAESWLHDTVSAAASGVFTVVMVPLLQCQFDAITAFVYNIGLHAFMHGGIGGTQSQVLQLLNSSQFKRAMDMHSMWCHDNGVVVAGLVRRRAAERAMFETANYSIRP